MASREQIQNVIDILETQVERAGYDLVETEVFEQEYEGGGTLELHRVVLNHGGNNVGVQGAVGYDYFTVFYSYDFLKDIGNNLDVEQAKAMFDDSDVPDSEETLKSQAAMRLLHRIDSEQMSHLDYELSKRLSSPLTGYDLWWTEQGAIYGFHTEKKIFPLEEDYSLYQFNEAVQAVVSQGVSGRKFLDRVFNIDLPEGETSTAIDLSVGIPEPSRHV